MSLVWGSGFEAPGEESSRESGGQEKHKPCDCWASPPME